jgi:hypothetical protein
MVQVSLLNESNTFIKKYFTTRFSYTLNLSKNENTN